MATTNFLVTFIFNGGRQGWSESWYDPGTDQTYDDTMKSAEQVGFARAGLLASGIYLEAIRVSRMDLFGDANTVAKPITFVDPQTSAKARDIVEIAWQWNAVAGEGGGLYRRQVWTRGQPDDWSSFVVGANRPTFPTDLKDKMDAFRDSLKLKGYSLRVKSKATPRKNINAVAIVDGRYVITVPGHGYTAEGLNIDGVLKRNTVHIRGVEGKGNAAEVAVTEFINGPDIPIIATDLNTITLGLVPDDVLTVPKYLGTGTVQLEEYIYAPVIDLRFVKLGKRDTGRAFFVPRGRSPNRKC